MAKDVLSKMHFRPGSRAIAINVPNSLNEVLKEVPNCETSKLKEKYDFVVFFAKNTKELEKDINEIKETLNPDSSLWIAYPKGKALSTDLNRDLLRFGMQNKGLIAVSLVAIDNTWSAMRFRLEKTFQFATP